MSAPGGTQTIRPPMQSSGQPGMRFGSFGMPTEKSTDFGTATRRLWKRLRRERVGVIVAIVLTFVSVAMTVSGPKVLGHATDVIVSGVVSHRGIDFGSLARVLAFGAFLFAGSWALADLVAWLLAGVVQRTMYRLRADVEDKLNRLPLSYVDRNQRGDLLSRVTNDIDNIAQSLQQTSSQMLTQTLTLVGTLALM